MKNIEAKLEDNIRNLKEMEERIECSNKKIKDSLNETIAEIIETIRGEVRNNKEKLHDLESHENKIEIA